MAHETAPVVGRTTINFLREFSVPLITGIVLALLWANLSPATYATAMHADIVGISMTLIINEVFMALFFGIAAVEITDSLVAGGKLNPLGKAVAPLMATVGGVVAPVGLYILLNAFFGGPELFRGWGITTATDIALAWLVARLVFKPGHPAISFLLLLAIVDDAIGLAIIAVFYPDPGHPVYVPALLLVALGMLLAWGLRRLGTVSYWPYLLLGGSASWLGLYWAHLHPALALVFIVRFMPHQRSRDQETAFDVSTREQSTLSTFEHEWKVVVDFGLFFFGLVNAGVTFSAVGAVTWLVLVSLFVGKTVGIVGLGVMASAIGFPLPGGMSRRDLVLVGMIAGIGLTVALFVAGAAFTDHGPLGAAKMGALASILIAPVVLVVKVLWPPTRNAPGG